MSKKFDTTPGRTALEIMEQAQREAIKKLAESYTGSGLKIPDMDPMRYPPFCFAVGQRVRDELGRVGKIVAVRETAPDWVDAIADFGDGPEIGFKLQLLE